MSGISGSGNIVTDGLVLYLDAANPKSFVSGSTTINDLSGNRYNGTLTNGPTYDSNNVGSVLFDGTNDTINLGVGPSSLGMTTGDFSVCIIFKNVNTTQGGLISSNYGSSLGNQYEFSITNQTNINITYYGGGNTTAQIEKNKWYLATHTFTYSSRTSKLYVNGSLKSSVNMTTTLTSISNLIIGWYGFGGGYFNGNISNIMIYNRALTLDEIIQNYNSLKNRYLL